MSRKPAYKTIARGLKKIRSQLDYQQLCNKHGQAHVDWVMNESSFLLNEYQRATIQGYASGKYQQLSLL
jgi:hypothetical protein